jgi:hypothetical protein
MLHLPKLLRHEEFAIVWKLAGAFSNARRSELLRILSLCFVLVRQQDKMRDNTSTMSSEERSLAQVSIEWRKR